MHPAANRNAKSGDDETDRCDTGLRECNQSACHERSKETRDLTHRLEGSQINLVGMEHIPQKILEHTPVKLKSEPEQKR